MDLHFSSVYTSTFCFLNVFSLTHHLVISCVILPAILRPSGTFFPLIWVQLPITPYAFPKLNFLSIRIYIKICNLLAWHDLCLLGLRSCFKKWLIKLVWFFPRTSTGIVEFHGDIWPTRTVQKRFVVDSVSEYWTSRTKISGIAVKVEFIDSKTRELATRI